MYFTKLGSPHLDALVLLFEPWGVNGVMKELDISGLIVQECSLETFLRIEEEMAAIDESMQRQQIRIEVQENCLLFNFKNICEKDLYR